MQCSCLLVALLFAIIIGTTNLVNGDEKSNCPCNPYSTFLLCGQPDQMCYANSTVPPPKDITCLPNGCYCAEGYLRRADGNCVPPKDCCDPKTEEYSDCGSPCPQTCEWLVHPDPGCTNNTCSLGCFCKAGLYRRSDGKCVNATECQIPRTECDPNLNEVSKCGSFCPQTCEWPVDRGFCSRMCPGGCFCNSTAAAPLLRRKDGKCVPPAECNIYCQVNQVFSACASPCPPTCMDPKVNCKEPCAPGCVCKPGLILDDFGKCIDPALCGKCGPNDIYYPATNSTCPPIKCGQYCRNDPPYGKYAAPNCPARCGCTAGYLLSDKQCCLPKDPLPQ